MGMGEPFANADNVFKAVNILTSKNALQMSPRKVSISTIGLHRGIRRLAEYPKNVNLLISLHSGIQEVRDKIMPNMKATPLVLLKKEIIEYQKLKKNIVTFEYIMIDGINDSLDDGRALKNFLSGIMSKVNIIAYNRINGCDFSPSTSDKIKEFSNYLKKRQIPTVQRYKKGDDIAAACGQLAGK